MVLISSNEVAKAKRILKKQIDNKTEFARDSKEILEKL